MVAWEVSERTLVGRRASTWREAVVDWSELIISVEF